jgi:predicted RNA-binding Zn ribbon-like protein
MRRFQLTGGDLSLDFVNTLDSRPSEKRKELLPTFGDVCSWARQASVITERQEKALKRKAAARPREAETARRRIVAARECLFRILAAIAEREKIPEGDLERWNRLARRAAVRFELVQREQGLAFRSAADPSFESLLWPVVHSAVRLLTGPEVSRLRRCASEECDWMFLDRSKRGNRRWCDMTVCGTRAKARRFYSRRKKSQRG